MNCPDCDSDTTSIVDTRQTDGGETVRRRRECTQCEFRYTTYERKDWDQLRVKKDDGTTELYDETKVQRGIERAVEKRPISAGQITEITTEITTEMKAQGEQIIDAETIGAAIADRLRDLDQVAFVRFVSVYRGYSDPVEFVDVLDEILADDALPGSQPGTDTDTDTDADADTDQSQSANTPTHTDQ